MLRRAGVACLRQLSQREAREVCDHAMTLVADKDAYYGDAGKQSGVNITETGLEGALFSLLDTETDVKLCSDVRDTLISMLQTLAIENLSRWLLLLKDVLQATGMPGFITIHIFYWTSSCWKHLKVPIFW